MERFVKRHQTIAARLPRGREGTRFELWPVREEIAASCVTAVKMPDGLTDDQIRGTMRHRYGVDDLAGLRRPQRQSSSASVTWVQPPIRPPSPPNSPILERSLADIGYPVQFGAGVGAAMAADRPGLGLTALDLGSGITCPGVQLRRFVAHGFPSTWERVRAGGARYANRRSGKVVIVTGGAGEIGSSDRPAAWSTRVRRSSSRTSERTPHRPRVESCGDAIFVRTDVTSKTRRTRMAAEALKAFGRSMP